MLIPIDFQEYDGIAQINPAQITMTIPDEEDTYSVFLVGRTAPITISNDEHEELWWRANRRICEVKKTSELAEVNQLLATGEWEIVTVLPDTGQAINGNTYPEPIFIMGRWSA